jgi:hypothetical protein
MFIGTVDDQDQWEKAPTEEQKATYERISQWFGEHGQAGKIVGGEELVGPTSATTVRQKNGKATVTDGPFIESKEFLGGFAVVEVKDLDEALEMAKTWPGGLVEVRPVVVHEAS